MKRTPVLLANWNMNQNYKNSIEWINKVSKEVPSRNELETVVCPTAPILAEAVKLQGENLRVGAQYFHFEDEGNFAGEFPAKTLADIGVTYGLVGIGKRTNIYHDTHEQNNNRIKKALENGIIPVVDVGEEIDPTDEVKSEQILYNEMFLELYQISKEDAGKIIIGFAPCWNDKYSTPENAQKYHKKIREYYEKLFGAEAAAKVRIIFGGNIQPETFEQFLSQPDIDGGHVGRASLDAEKFLTLVKTIKK